MSTLPPSPETVEGCAATSGDPTRRDSTPATTLNGLKDEGNELLRQGRLAEAQGRYLKALALTTESTEAAVRIALHGNLALCYLRMNEPRKVLAQCEAALDLQPTNEKCLFRKAKAHYLLGERARATALLHRVLAVNRDNADAITLLRTLQPSDAAGPPTKSAASPTLKQAVQKALAAGMYAEKPDPKPRVSAQHSSPRSRGDAGNPHSWWQRIAGACGSCCRTRKPKGA
jgi:tetratricopeptide (TPR) repeat protein